MKLTSGQFNGLTAYDGVLNWTDTINKDAQGHFLTYSTYCIDLSAVISPAGNPYHFSLMSLSQVTGNGAGQYSSAQINAMENLWAQHPTEGNVGVGITPSIDAGHAAMFQTALWSILDPTLTFGSPGSGFSQTQLDTVLNPNTAIGWVAMATSVTYSGSSDDFQVLVSTDHGQNQAMYLVGPLSQPAGAVADFAAERSELAGWAGVCAETGAARTSLGLGT